MWEKKMVTRKKLIQKIKKRVSGRFWQDHAGTIRQMKKAHLKTLLDAVSKE